MVHLRRPAFWAGLFVVSAWLSGCATTQSISDVGFPLDDSALYVSATQSELATASSSTNPMAAGGGLLGVLIVHGIDSSRNRRAEEAVAELRDALLDFPIADEFVHRLQASGLPGQLSRLDPTILTETPASDFAHTRDFIELHPKVQLANDLAALEVSIWIRRFELNNRNQPRFAGFAQGYKFVHPLPEPDNGTSRADYAEAWLAMGPEAIEALIRQGMDLTIDAASYHVGNGSLTSRTATRYRIPDYSSRLPYDLRRLNGDWFWLSTRPNPREIIITHRSAALPIN